MNFTKKTPFSEKWQVGAKSFLAICLLLTQAGMAAPNVDALLKQAKSLKESAYSTPSWTAMKIASGNATANPNDATAKELEAALKSMEAYTAPYSIVMSFNGDPKSRMGFTWYTNQGVDKGAVQIVAGKVASADAFKKPAFTFDADTTCFVTNYSIDDNKIEASSGIPAKTLKSYSNHKVVATGLKPGTTYSFRVGYNGNWSEIGTFSTAKAGKDTFSFIYTTDPQAEKADQFDISQRTMHTALSMYPNSSFLLNCGDLAETNDAAQGTSSEWEYEQFFRTQQDLFLKYPIAPVEGNHDWSQNQNFTRHFNTSSPAFDSKNTVPGSIYSFVYHDVLFMGLNFQDISRPGMSDSIAAWMRQQVAQNPSTKWRIVFCHTGLYMGSSHHFQGGGPKKMRATMGPVFDELKIDLTIEGHDHVYQVIGPIKKKELVAGAVTDQQTVEVDPKTNLTGKMNGTYNVSKGTLYFINGSSGKKKYEASTREEMDKQAGKTGITNYFDLFTGRFGQGSLPTFSNVSVSQDAIQITTYEVKDDNSTSIFDSFKIVK